MNRNLYRLLRKCKYHVSLNQWCGYLTPVEILILDDLGINVPESNERKIRYAKIEKENGICNPGWFYFNPRKALKDMLDNVHKKQESRFNKK